MKLRMGKEFQGSAELFLPVGEIDIFLPRNELNKKYFPSSKKRKLIKMFLKSLGIPSPTYNFPQILRQIKTTRNQYW